MSEQDLHKTRFFLTAPTECPYLPDQWERKVFTHLPHQNADQIHHVLAHNGFRRSQSLLYRPACDDCNACKSARVIVDDFTPSARFRRVLNKNKSIIGIERPAVATQEQFELFQTYLLSRHADGGMAEMDQHDFTQMVEDTSVDTMLVEYRDQASRNALVGVSLTDRLDDGLSMVYSFFDPSLAAKSLGTFMILDHIERSKLEGKDYLYLGYWVSGSRKMDYKTQYRPLQLLENEEYWVDFDKTLNAARED